MEPHSTHDWISRQFLASVTWLERLLALVVVVGIAVYGVASGLSLVNMDWQSTDTFYELLYRVLLMVIALELVRMLIAHDLSAVLELLAFVTARKVLKPDISALDIVLSAVAFVALLAARRYFLTVPTHKAHGEHVQAENSPRSGQVQELEK